MCTWVKTPSLRRAVPSVKNSACIMCAERLASWKLFLACLPFMLCMDARDCKYFVPQRHIAFADQVCQTVRCGGVWVHVDSLLTGSKQDRAFKLKPMMRGLCLSYACVV